MRAVNLIPTDQRSGTPVGAGRSQGAAYAVLAVLAGFAVLAVLYGKAHREVSSRKSEAAKITAEAAGAQAKANALAPYTSFVQLREERAQAVATLVNSRFDWAHAFHEFGRVLTGDTSISSLQGQVGSGTATASGSPAPSPAPTTTAGAASAPTTTAGAASASAATSATPPGSVPSFTLSGCATSQSAVAQTLQRLRLIDGVSDVTLQSSTKGTASGAGGAGGCPAGAPVFQIGVTFDPLPSAAASAAAVKSPAQPVSNTSAGGSSSAPASTGGKAG
jgi:hypothetical protein